MDRYRECSKCRGKVGEEYPGLHCIKCGGKIQAPKQDGQRRIQTKRKVSNAT